MRKVGRIVMIPAMTRVETTKAMEWTPTTRGRRSPADAHGADLRGHAASGLHGESERSQERRELAGDGVGRDSTGDRSQVQHAERSVRDDRDRRTGREAQDRHDQCGTAADDDRAAAPGEVGHRPDCLCAELPHRLRGVPDCEVREGQEVADVAGCLQEAVVQPLGPLEPRGRIRGGNPMQTSQNPQQEFYACTPKSRSAYHPDLWSMTLARGVTHRPPR